MRSVLYQIVCNAKILGNLNVLYVQQILLLWQLKEMEFKIINANVLLLILLHRKANVYSFALKEQSKLKMVNVSRAKLITAVLAQIHLNSYVKHV